MTNVVEIEGIGPAYAEKLGNAGVPSVEGLLDVGATPKGRKEIADRTGISEHLILKWVNHSDLFRVDGVAGEYAELLEASGVDTVPELAQRNPTHLQAKMAEVNHDKRLVRRVPNEPQVARWVNEAKTLPRRINY
jgi:predicted flap endonuclease-1-like 5' DNA nuclease